MTSGKKHRSFGGRLLAPLGTPAGWAVAALAAALAGPRPAAAQGPASTASEVFAGSETERYVRNLQVAGKAPAYPWSVRAFSPLEAEHLAPTDSAHPWAGRLNLRRDSARASWGLISPQARLFYNSAFPYATNDGAVWAGRGATLAVRAGVHGRFGPVSVVIAPEVFRSQNTDFTLMENGDPERSVYADWLIPSKIDYPQRFGDGSYGRIDPGQSTIRVDLRGVAAGVSTANQVWGPADEHPLILGNAGPGFPHAFLGTSRPVDVWIGRVHGRVVYGRIAQSEYSPAADSVSQRFMAGLVGVFQPRGIPGLEVGAARFFHDEWPGGSLGVSDLLKPFEGLIKTGLEREDDDPSDGVDRFSSPDNQLASLFFRWVAPRAGVELYGEYAREDHSFDARDLILEPDYDAGYLLGFRKVWAGRPDRMLALRGELLNTRPGNLIRARGRAGIAPFYIHNFFPQGHTARGQFLGSRAGYGGGGTVLALDAYRPRGRWTVAWTREERGTDDRPNGEGADRAATADVFHTLGAESLFSLGRFDATAGVTGVYELNRYLRDDAFNLNVNLGVQWRP